MQSETRNYVSPISIGLAVLLILVGGVFSETAASQESEQAGAELRQVFRQTLRAEGKIDEDSAAGEARYIQQTKLTAADAANDDNFGFEVAIVGDTAVVGMPRDDIGSNADQGSAYVFVRSSQGVWILQQKLIAVDGTAQDFFGETVAVANASAPSETVIMVGAYGNNPGGVANRGAVYVFRRATGGTTWTAGGKLTSSDGIANDAFGTSVALTGTTAVIGANGVNLGTDVDAGAAYIFVRNGTVWQELQKITDPSPVTDKNFGWDVDVSGDVIVVGDNYPQSDAGRIYIYERAAGGSSWTWRVTFLGGGNFGSQVAVSGDYIVAGSPQTNALFEDDGAASIYQRVNGTWTNRGAIYAADSADFDNFGSSVDIEGDTIVVGALGDDAPGNVDTGAAYVFTRSGNVWTQQRKLTDANAGIADYLGNSVSISGDTILAGAWLDDVDSFGQAGSVSVFKVAAGAPFDYDGDGKADVSVFRPSNGAWYLQQSQNGFTGVTFGASGDKIVPADYDGDGKTDVAVFRNGTWYLQRSSLGFTGVAFGAATDIPVPADYDGDGKADVAVFRPSTGAWYIQASTLGFYGIGFGQNGDAPVAADYDGDGKADVAVFRAGVWYLNRSQAGFTGISFGQSGDRPVPADFDGDNKADVAVFRSGTWYLLRSQLGFTGINFGLSTDIPVPADYDGDAKTDVAVFRPSAGAWYLQRSQAGFTGVSFGLNGDVPTPSAYVP